MGVTACGVSKICHIQRENGNISRCIGRKRPQRLHIDDDGVVVPHTTLDGAGRNVRSRWTGGVFSLARVLNKLATGVDDGRDGGTTSCVGESEREMRLSRTASHLYSSFHQSAAAQQQQQLGKPTKKFHFPSSNRERV